MNPVQTKISEHLRSIPKELGGLRDCCLRYLEFCSAIGTDGTVMIGHRPWVAPLNYVIMLYPVAKTTWFKKYRELHGTAIPSVLHPLLSVSNGFFAFGTSICGMPPSMLKPSGTLDRSRLQCHDIGSASTYTDDYGVAGNAFRFGGREFSSSQNTGYFVVGKKRFISVLPGGKIVGEWSNLNELLRDELSASEKQECASVPKDWWH